MNNRQNQAGFTLVELSIVLIIIGLIVGGVLAGQSLVKAAKLQSEITRYTQIDTAVNTFSLNYSGLPGDTKTVGTFATAITNVAAGDGNGFIGVTGDTVFKATEIGNADAELIAAGLVPGALPAGFDVTANAAADIGNGIIPAKLAGGIVLYGDAAHNWVRYGLNGDTVAGTIGLTNLFTSDQVLAIDSKLDDSVATTGIVQSRDVTTVGTVGLASGVVNTDCNDANGAYIGGTANTCSFAIRLSQ